MNNFFDENWVQLTRMKKKVKRASLKISSIRLNWTFNTVLFLHVFELTSSKFMKWNLGESISIPIVLIGWTFAYVNLYVLWKINNFIFSEDEEVVFKILKNLLFGGGKLLNFPNWWPFFWALSFEN